MHESTIRSATDAVAAMHDTANKIAEYAEVESKLSMRIADAAHSSTPSSIDRLLETLVLMETEVQLHQPNVAELHALLEELNNESVRRLRKAAEEIAHGGTDLFGPNESDQAQKIKELSERITKLAERKTAEIYAQIPTAPLIPVDNTEIEEEDQDMSTTTDRDYIEAKLEATEARMDGRVASIEASIAGFLGRQEERFGRLDDRMVRIEQSASQTQADIKSLKSTIIVTAISVVLAIVLGVAAFNATVLSNMVASFESGKNTSAAQAELKKQSEETAALLKKMQEDFEGRKSPTTAGKK